MKISAATISLLQSFSNISANLLVKPGKKLRTRNAVNSVQARAEVEEDFTTQFAIYDLHQFLELLRISTEPDITFEDKSMTIKSAGGGETRYFYADSSLIITPADGEPKIETHFTFALIEDDINVIQKTASLLSATMLSIVAKSGKVTLSINDPKNASSNTYKQSLGECDLTFDVRMSMDNFKVDPDTYDVQIVHVVGKSGARALAFYFSSTTRTLTYLVAADTTSKLKE